MARVILKDGSSELPIDLVDAITVAGRAPENRIILNDKMSSRRQFQIERTEFGYKVVDLESRNGTKVNDQQVNQALLRPGDRIRVGDQIIVFEDGNWREPAGEMANRFTPAVPQPAHAAPPPPSAQATPAAPQPAVPVTEHGLNLRRTGRSRVDAAQRDDRRIVKNVVIGVGIFGVLLVGLIVAGSLSNEPPALVNARRDYNEAYRIWRQDPQRAVRLLEGIPIAQSQYHKQAQDLIQKINASGKGATAGSADEGEKKEFDALYEFCEANRANPTAYENMYRRCEEFKQKYPSSSSTRQVEEYRRLAYDGLQGTRSSEMADTEKRTKESLAKQEYADALKRVNTLLVRFKDDIDLRERLLKLHDEALEAAKGFQQSEHARAEEFKSRGKRDEARKIYVDVILKLGDNSVDELRDWCKLAKLRRDALQ